MSYFIYFFYVFGCLFDRNSVKPLRCRFFTFTSVISLSEKKHYSIKNGYKMTHNHDKTTSTTTKMIFFKKGLASPYIYLHLQHIRMQIMHFSLQH